MRRYERLTDGELEALTDMIDAFAREIPVAEWDEDHVIVIHDINGEIGRRRNQRDLAAQRQQHAHNNDSTSGQVPGGER